jgi:hypothetical protein
MKEKEKKEYSLPTLLLVTGCCFLLFAIFLRILDGVSVKFFLRTGFIIFVSGVLTGTYILMHKKTEQRRAN